MKRLFIVLFALVSLSITELARSEEYTLNEVLNLTRAHSPDVAVAKAQRDVASDQVGISKAQYLPKVNLEAIESSGFPGSSGRTGVGGIMGSPYRSGFGIGLTLEQTLWDFGRTQSAVAADEVRVEIASVGIDLSFFRNESAAIRAFYECSLFRSQADGWEYIRKESEIIANEVGRFVKTGQKSIVEKYLVDAQTEEALTNESSYNERYMVSRKLIALMTGQEVNKMCPLLTLRETKEIVLNLEAHTKNSMVRFAEEEVILAKLGVDRAKSQYLPRLVGTGSFGELEKTRLVANKDYAISVGLVFPLFDGFKTHYEVLSAKAAQVEKERAVDLSKENYQKLILRLDDSINASKIRYLHLQKELELAEKGFKIAKQRYFSFKGSLIDIREALRNVARTRTQLNEAASEYAVSQNIQVLF